MLEEAKDCFQYVEAPGPGLTDRVRVTPSRCFLCEAKASELLDVLDVSPGRHPPKHNRTEISGKKAESKKTKSLWMDGSQLEMRINRDGVGSRQDLALQESC